MKCIFTLVIKTDDSLKVKRHTLVIISCEGSWNPKERIKKEEEGFSNPIIVREADDLEVKVEQTGALKKTVNRKGFQCGLVNGKFLEHYFASRTNV